MLGSELITQVRYRVRDTMKKTYTDEELLMYANDAIQTVGADLIPMKHQHLLETGSFANADSVPTGWVAWCGQVPAEVYGGKIYLLAGASTPLAAKYVRKPAVLATVASTVDLPDEFIPAVVTQTAILALNRNGLDVQPEMAIAQATSQAAQKANSLES